MNYLKYYRRALELMGPRGVILIDNVLWSGDVLKSKDVDSSTAAIQELNRIIAADQGVKAVLVTIRDGIFVVRKA
jgi:caffeoyl-CoA O-methyltransferase